MTATIGALLSLAAPSVFQPPCKSVFGLKEVLGIVYDRSARDISRVEKIFASIRDWAGIWRGEMEKCSGDDVLIRGVFCFRGIIHWVFSEVGRVFVGNGGCWGGGKGDVSLFSCWLDSNISLFGLYISCWILEKLSIEYQSIKKSVNILSRNDFNSFSDYVYARLYVSRYVYSLLNNEKKRKNNYNGR